MTEDLSCYGNPLQREILKTVAAAPLFRDFFLTGGTCLAVSYLHHRVSHDLAFFTTATWISRHSPLTPAPSCSPKRSWQPPDISFRAWSTASR